MFHFISPIMLAFMTDGQNTFHFTPNIWSKIDRQKHSISLVVLESKKTNYVSFNPHILIYASQMDKTIMTDGQTSFHHSYWYPNKTDKLFSPLILESTQDRQTTFYFISPLTLAFKTDGQNTFHFNPHIGIQERHMDKLRFV